MDAATSTKTTAPLPEAVTAAARGQIPVFHPEWFRLPGRGGDPYFGQSRSQYYCWEKEGRLRMVRLRRPGATRGVVLISYAAVKAIVEAATEK